jgi:hypothetical protein
MLFLKSIRDFAGITIILCIALQSNGAEPSNSESANAISISLPLLDYPENYDSYPVIPTMQQSIEVTKTFYQGTHYIIGRLVPRSFFGYELLHNGFDFLSFYLPFGESWLHEEFHRAVMSRWGIDSYNEVYDFNLLSSVIKVSHVRDDDLVRLKDEHPADMVRLAEAGMEGQYSYFLSLQKDRFFSSHNQYGRFGNLVGVLNSISYVILSNFAYADRTMKEHMEKEGTDISARDFTGWDFTAWVYDLHRPDEPYAERGEHPSGVGIDRYILIDDLTKKEKEYLQTQSWLTLLNLIDLNLYKESGIDITNSETGTSFKFSFGLRHLLTSFGYTIDCNLFWQRGIFNVFASIHNYINGARYFPGLELELVEFPMQMGSLAPIKLTPRLMTWLQPESQRFSTRRQSPGYLLSLEIGWPVYDYVQPYVEVETKSDGWVAGNVYLNKHSAIRAGLTSVFDYPFR